MTVEERARLVASREDLVAFVGALHADFVANPRSWPNCDLSRFLEAMAGWAADMDGYYLNRGEPIDRVSPYRIAAELLVAARVYE